MKGIKKILWIYIRFVQKILITILLTLTYITIIPFSWLFMVLFRQQDRNNSIEKKSHWIKVSAIQISLSEYKEQS